MAERNSTPTTCGNVQRLQNSLVMNTIIRWGDFEYLEIYVWFPALKSTWGYTSGSLTKVIRWSNLKLRESVGIFFGILTQLQTSLNIRFGWLRTLRGVKEKQTNKPTGDVLEASMALTFPSMLMMINPSIMSWSFFDHSYNWIDYYYYYYLN